MHQGEKAVKDRFSLENKLIFVSGASGGIAQGIARGLAGTGASFVLASRNESVLKNIVQSLSDVGAHAIPVALDITRSDSIRAAVSKAVDVFGKIDVLINCAATNVRKPFLEMAEEDYDLVMNTNARGLYFLTQEVCRVMVPRKHGKIVHVASFVSYVALSTVTAYVASKGAVAQMTKAMAVDLARYNIQVNAIAPGFIKTPFNKLIWNNKEKNEWVVEHTLARRFGMPEDLVGVAHFLSSEASDFMTGQIVLVDGGLMAGSDRLFG